MRYVLLTLPIALMALSQPTRADIAEAVQSTVSILPIRQAGTPVRPGTGRGQIPEATGIVVGRTGYIATARHVIDAVKQIEVRLADGRVLPARRVGADAATDIALLKIDAELTAFRWASPPRLAQRACAIGNAFGLDLSVTCGVVSALNVSHAGFNPIEDFIQTDAPANPGSSGGALVDESGRLVGMLSAIFAAKSDTNIGVNFAVSARLLRRVVDDLKDDGRVDYVQAGWRLGPLSRLALRSGPGATLLELDTSGPASRAGLRTGDVIRRIAARTVRGPRGAMAALALLKQGESASVTFERDGETRTTLLKFESKPKVATTPTRSQSPTPRDADCPYPKPVCDVRQAVFPIESFDPLASAVRVAPDLLVTNRHAVGAHTTATVMTPAGPLSAQVIPSAYDGDLALLKVNELPADGFLLNPSIASTDSEPQSRLLVVGADIARREIRVFQPGKLLRPPAPNAPLGRLHVSSQMQPGVSGGALVDLQGRFIGIAVGGGEGRNEAIPVSQVVRLLNQRAVARAAERHALLGRELEACAMSLDAAEQKRGGRDAAPQTIAEVARSCAAANNLGQLLRATRILAF
ncbi:MAG: trypsin-like peptidase domain-containing protein, partial [Pseudomonadota bacterium]